MSVCSQAYLKNEMSKFHFFVHIAMFMGWSFPCSTVMHYCMYFRFVDDSHVCIYWPGIGDGEKTICSE